MKTPGGGMLQTVLGTGKDWNHMNILPVGLHWSVTLKKSEFRPGIEIIVCMGEQWWDDVPCGRENLSFIWSFNLDIILLNKTGSTAVKSKEICFFIL